MVKVASGPSGRVACAQSGRSCRPAPEAVEIPLAGLQAVGDRAGAMVAFHFRNRRAQVAVIRPNSGLSESWYSSCASPPPAGTKRVHSMTLSAPGSPLATLCVKPRAVASAAAVRDRQRAGAERSRLEQSAPIQLQHAQKRAVSWMP